MLTDAPVKVVPPVLISVIPPPAAGAAHFNPVGETELSATNFGTISEDCSKDLEPVSPRQSGQAQPVLPVLLLSWL
jgi:hypothetical protein